MTDHSTSGEKRGELSESICCVYCFCGDTWAKKSHDVQEGEISTSTFSVRRQWHKFYKSSWQWTYFAIHINTWNIVLMRSSLKQQKI